MTNAELQERKRIARHEALQGLLGLRVGAVIEEIRCFPYGETCSRFPLNPWTLKYTYARAPDETQVRTTRIIAALIAPAVVMRGEILGGGDLELYEQWLHAWSALPGAISAGDVRAAAILDAMDWYRPRRAFVERVAMALMQRRKVWGHSAWHRLVQDCQTPEAPRLPHPGPHRHGSGLVPTRLEWSTLHAFQIGELRDTPAQD